MKKLYTSKKTAGIGLIEVLITTVVVALGLLAVASFQGSLIGESRENKSRTEAKALAESKIEEFRDAIIRDVLVAGVVPAVAPFLPADTTGATDTVAGVTESFTRTWSVSDQAVPERKEIEVSICWSDGCPLATGNTNNQIYVQGEVVFDNVANSAKNLKDAQSAAGTTGSPSTNANSSDEINDATDVDISGSTAGSNSLHSIDGLESGQYVKDNGNSDDKGSIVYLCDDLIPFENGLYTRRVHYNPSGTTFKDAIELFEDNLDSLTCTRKIRFNGGVIIPIRGTVYSRATDGNGANADILNVDLFTFNATESGTYCVFNHAAGDFKGDYSCYVGGNCTNGTIGDSPVTGENAMQCPTPPDAGYAEGTYQEIGPGGWRGKVGLLGIPVPSKNVCFQEEIQDSASTKDTARNYFTRRVIEDGTNFNEGINQAYHCHNFLIVDGKNTLTQLAGECLDSADDDNTGVGSSDGSPSLVNKLASKTVSRSMTTEDNQFNPVVNTDFCSGVVVDTAAAAVAVATAHTIQAVIDQAAIATSTAASDEVKAAAVLLLSEINTAKTAMDAAYALGTDAGNTEAIRLSEEVIHVKAAEITAILSSLGTIYEVNGTISNGTSSVIVTAANAACTQTASSYFCQV